MKAGAFGRQPERRQVQPGGRILPGMFVAPAAASAINKTSSPSSSRRPSTQTAARRSPPKQEAARSRWGGNEQGSGRFPAPASSTAATPRLDPTGGRSPSPNSSARRPTPADSIARARRLGLKRAPRTPPPRPSESGSDSSEDERQPTKPVHRKSELNHPAATTRTRARSKSNSSSPSRRRQLPKAGGEDHHRDTAGTVASVPPEPARSDPVETVATTRPPPRPLPGLLSSLWNRASELVGGNAPAPELDEAASSSGRQAAVDAGTDPVNAGEVQEDGAGSGSEKDPRRGKRPARPVVVPALVAPALAGITPNAHVAEVRTATSAPTLAPVQPITYHRPPPLHPRATHEEVPRFRSQPTPFDWLDPRDESRVLPYMFMPSATQAAAYEARLRAQAAKATAQSAHPSALPPAHWTGPAAQLSAPPHASVSYGPSQRTGISHTSPLAMVAASMTDRPPPSEHSTEVRRAASEASHPADAERRGPNASTIPGGATAPALVAAGTLSGGAAAVPPLVQSAFVPERANGSARDGDVPPATVPTNAAPTSAAAALAPASMAPTLPPPMAPATGSGAAQALPVLASAPFATYGTMPAPAPPVEYLPRYTETEQAAPRSPSPQVQPIGVGTVAGSAALGAAAGSAASSGAAGPALASSNGPLSEVPRAGVGGDSLPIHPSPVQYSAEAPSSAPVVPSSTVFPATVPAGAGLWQTASAPTVGWTSQLGERSAPPLAVSAPTTPLAIQPAAASPPPFVPPASFPAATAAPAVQPTPTSLPPLVPPASFPALQTSAPCVSMPSMVPLYGAAVPRDPKLSSISAEMMKGASTALKRAVLAMDPTTNPAATGVPTTWSRFARQGSKPSRGGEGSATTSKDDLPPMPKPRPIPVSPPPPSESLDRSQPPHASSSTPHPASARRGSPYSAGASSVATSTIDAIPAVAASPVSSAASDLSTPVYQGTQKLSVVAAEPTASLTEPAEQDSAGAAASVVSSRSETSTSRDTPCSSPATTLPASVSPPPPLPPAVPVKSPPLTSLSPPPVPRRPASIPPLPHSVSPPPAGNITEKPTALSHEPAARRRPATDEPLEALEALSAAPAVVPVAQQPRIELQKLDLDLPDFGVGFSVSTPIQVDPTRSPSPGPNDPRDLSRPSSSTARPAPSDPLDDAFEETTTFVTGFEHASLLRATIDPNHTGRTEKWLEQMGVRPRLVSEIDRRPEQSRPSLFPDSFFRPLTAPPASIAPESSQIPGPWSPASRPAQNTPKPGQSEPSIPFRFDPSHLRPLGTTGVVGGDLDSIGSPLETSIGQVDSASGLLNRGRAVSPDFEARAHASSKTPVKAITTPDKVNSPAILDAGRPSAPVSAGAGGPDRDGTDSEPLVGDKGETASEVAAMFANW
ncbi:hypothetical protein JCM3774_000431 [Rhodotorula dairenensis]